MSRFVIALLTGLLAALSACEDVHPVTSFPSTNLLSAPGTAGDVTTGGHGNDIRRR